MSGQVSGVSADSLRDKRTDISLSKESVRVRAWRELRRFVDAGRASGPVGRNHHQRQQREHHDQQDVFKCASPRGSQRHGGTTMRPAGTGVKVSRFGSSKDKGRRFTSKSVVFVRKNTGLCVLLTTPTFSWAVSG